MKHRERSSSSEGPPVEKSFATFVLNRFLGTSSLNNDGMRSLGTFCALEKLCCLDQIGRQDR